MMMNIRGLIFDDPQGTADIKLPTLEFIVADDPVDNQTTNANVHATENQDHTLSLSTFLFMFLRMSSVIE